MQSNQIGVAWATGYMTGLPLSLKKTIDSCRYKTIIARQFPAPIGGIWHPVKGDPLPIPDELLIDMSAKFHLGAAIVLIASKRSVRDRAKSALVAMLDSKGTRA